MKADDGVGWRDGMGLGESSQGILRHRFPKSASVFVLAPDRDTLKGM